MTLLVKLKIRTSKQNQVITLCIYKVLLVVSDELLNITQFFLIYIKKITVALYPRLRLPQLLICISGSWAYFYEDRHFKSYGTATGTDTIVMGVMGTDAIIFIGTDTLFLICFSLKQYRGISRI